MATIWSFVTDFGDSAVTAPLALLTLIFLVFAGQRRLALGWMLAIGGCAVVMVLLKLVFGACGSQLTLAHIVSPSGHTAMSTSVYGSLVLLVGGRLAPRRRNAIFVVAAIAVVGIALSRLALHDHTRAEITVGFGVGAGAVLVFRAILRRYAAPELPLRWLVLCGAGLVAVMHGTRWMIEPTIHRLAWEFRLDLPWCR